MKYKKQFSEIYSLISASKEKAIRAVNVELIDLYWNIGKYINQRVELAEWGKGVVKNLADYLIQQDPEIKGFSPQNLWRMRQFYLTYKDTPHLTTLLREIPWSGHLHLISKTKSPAEREFYLQLAIKEKYKVRELGRQIDSALFERVLISDGKVSTSLKESRPEITEIFRDTYALDFLGLPQVHSEKDLQKAILGNLKQFILEIGRDFIFMAEEFRIQVGNHDYYIDMVFFHRGLRCLVAFDLKIDEFKPEYLGKMAFYLEALDQNVRKENENLSVGIILCKGKDHDVVEYSLNTSLSSTMISDYHTKLIPKEVLESKLNHLFRSNGNQEG